MDDRSRPPIKMVSLFGRLPDPVSETVIGLTKNRGLMKTHGKTKTNQFSFTWQRKHTTETSAISDAI